MSKKQTSTILALIVIVAIFGIGYGLRITTLTPTSSLSRLKIKVLDETTEAPIEGVLIQMDHVGWLYPSGNVDYQAETDSFGIASETVHKGEYFFSLYHPEYKSRAYGLDSVRLSDVLLTYTMAPSDTDPSGHTLTVHLLGTARPIEQGSITINGFQHLTLDDKTIKVYDLAQGAYTVTFEARYRTGSSLLYQIKSFSGPVNMPNRDHVVTVYMDSESIIEGTPPTTPPPQIIPRWVYAAAFIVLFLMLFVILFQGSGPWIVNQFRGSRGQ